MDFEFFIEPVPKGRPRIGRGGIVYTPAKTRLFERSLRGLLKSQWAAKPIEGPLEVIITCCLARPKSATRFWPTVRPDVDNLAKSILDAIQGEDGLFLDDSQICSLTCRKVYALDQTPKILVQVNQLFSPDAILGEYHKRSQSNQDNPYNDE